MSQQELNVVTGAFGHTGRYITERLLSLKKRVTALTGHPNRPDPFGGEVRAVPFNFDNENQLTKSMEGAVTLYNTYWIRFSYRKLTFETAIRNTKKLIHAAKKAGIQRIVHISITNPSLESPLPYFRGKAILEKVIMESGLSYAIVRPTVMFGPQGLLINNIAWLLRRFPVFVIPGSGEYQLQPVLVDDVAEISINAALKDENVIIDAAGPETYTFNELVLLIAKRIKSKARIIHLPSGLALTLSRLVGFTVRDLLLTRDEIYGLMANLLISKGDPEGHTHFSEWLKLKGQNIGIEYLSELALHYR